MGRANPVLTLWVADQWFSHPAVEELANAGHRIYRMSGCGTAEPPDLILHPAAHWWSDDMWEALPAALVAARKRRKASKHGA